VNSFNLVFSDDGVLERGTIGKDEDSIGVASLCLTSAGDAATISLETTVESARDLHSLLESLGASGDRNGERSTLGHALMKSVYVSQAVRSWALLTKEVLWGRLGWAGRCVGSESQDGSNDRSLHVDGWVD
jgi:hypothetical protein